MQPEELKTKQVLAAKDLTFVILCGGKSSRMGENKTFLPFGKYSSLIHFQYERLTQAFPYVYISSKTNEFPFLNDNSFVILDNNKEIYSPLIALKSILEQIKTSKVFILTVDTPFVSLQTIKELITHSENYEITIASTPEKVHNLCGIFSTSLLPKIDEMLTQDIHKIGFLIKQSLTQIVEFNDEKEFLNMNTKSDYFEALNIINNYSNS